MFRNERYSALLVVFDDKGRKFVSGTCFVHFLDDQIVIDLSKDDWDDDNKTLTFRLRYKNGKFYNPQNHNQMSLRIDSDVWEEDLTPGGMEGLELKGLWDGQAVVIGIEELVR